MKRRIVLLLPHGMGFAPGRLMADRALRGAERDLVIGRLERLQ